MAELIGTAEDPQVVGEASGVGEALARVPQANPGVAVLAAGLRTTRRDRGE